MQSIADTYPKHWQEITSIMLVLTMLKHYSSIFQSWWPQQSLNSIQLVTLMLAIHGANFTAGSWWTSQKTLTQWLALAAPFRKSESTFGKRSLLEIFFAGSRCIRWSCCLGIPTTSGSGCHNTTAQQRAFNKLNKRKPTVYGQLRGSFGLLDLLKTYVILNKVDFRFLGSQKCSYMCLLSF